MAEVQTSTESGEMAQRFIELVMMQAQNAAYALGQIPHPETGEAPVNLDLARLFIDQLIVLRAKTRDNLSSDELGILNNAISNLQMVFVEVSQGRPAAAQRRMPQPRLRPPLQLKKPRLPQRPVRRSRRGIPEKFTKSYGA